MSNLQGNFLRQSENLKLSFFSTQKLLYLCGHYGSFYYPLYSPFFYSKTKKKLWLSYPDKTNQAKTFLKMYQILMGQAALGALVGYRKQLNIVGIGYQVSVESKGIENFLNFKLGYSHQILVQIPDFISVKCPKPRVILLRAVNLQKLCNFTANLRRLKLPSAYKEKGIYYLGESVKLKPGKKT